MFGSISLVSNLLIQGIQEIYTKAIKFSGKTNPRSFILKQLFTQCVANFECV